MINTVTTSAGTSTPVMAPTPKRVVAAAAPISSPRLKSPNRLTRSAGGNSTLLIAVHLLEADSTPHSPPPRSTTAHRHLRPDSTAQTEAAPPAERRSRRTGP